jgi:hypothetical protein
MTCKVHHRVLHIRYDVLDLTGQISLDLSGPLMPTVNSNSNGGPDRSFLLFYLAAVDGDCNNLNSSSNLGDKMMSVLLFCALPSAVPFD